VLGQTAHASLKGAGVNAVAHGARLATALEGVTPIHQLHELAGESWWAVTEIEGGIEPAIIPDHCDLTLDVRLVPGQTCAGIWDEVQAVIDRLANEVLDFRCEVDVVECREPWEIDPESDVASAIAAGVRGATGRDAELFAFPGTTDGSYLVPAGIPVCDLRSRGPRADSPRERGRADRRAERRGTGIRAYGGRVLR
jgi:acetylornithine deacetylase/succinyl-diaminopimelate desuccinylase-like protein